MLTSVSTVQGVLLVVSSAPSSGAPVLDGVPLLQAVSASSAVAAIPMPASVRVRRMCVSFVCCVCRVWVRSVREELREEVLGPVALGVREELLRRGLFHDTTVGHEDDPVGRLAGEAHLVG